MLLARQDPYDLSWTENVLASAAILSSRDASVWAATENFNL